jgi:two-component system chemotaxis response regulator CheV
VLTLVNLAKFPNVRAKEVANEDRLVILMELNDLRVGVSVDEVERIYRRSWSDIEPPLLIILNAGTPITGVTRIDDEIIPINY